MGLGHTSHPADNLDHLMLWGDPDSWKIWAGFIAGVLALILVYMMATGELG